jgi:recombination protein RecT
MSKALTVVGNYSPEDLQVMRETLATGTNDAQFGLFIRTAHAAGLNPFLNHIYAPVYQGKMTLQIGIEGITYLAKQKEGYKGYDAQTVCDNDVFKAKRVKVKIADGEQVDMWEVVEHEIGFPRGKIIGAYAIAYREGFRPYTVLMDISEVEHFFTSSIGAQQTMWKKFTADMFKKHVLKRALKGQFGIDINEDEQPVGPGTTEIEQEPVRKNVRNDGSETESAPGKSTKTAGTPSTDPAEDDEAAQIKKARVEMKKKFAQLGITDPDEMTQYISDNAKIKGDKPTLAEYKGLLKIMDLHIAEKQAQQSEDDELPV